jgi:hypothetical protein
MQAFGIKAERVGLGWFEMEALLGTPEKARSTAAQLVSAINTR